MRNASKNTIKKVFAMAIKARQKGLYFDRRMGESAYFLFNEVGAQVWRMTNGKMCNRSMKMTKRYKRKFKPTLCDYDKLANYLSENTNKTCYISDVSVQNIVCGLDFNLRNLHNNVTYEMDGTAKLVFSNGNCVHLVNHRYLSTFLISRRYIDFGLIVNAHIRMDTRLVKLRAKITLIS